MLLEEFKAFMQIYWSQLDERERIEAEDIMLTASADLGVWGRIDRLTKPVFSRGWVK